MTIENFIALLNTKLEAETLQIIPSHSAKKLPPSPFATYDILEDSDSDEIMLDGREVTPEDKLIEKVCFRDEVELTFKVHSRNKSQALLERDELYKRIVFKWREEIVRSGFGIVEYSKAGPNHQKIENKYLYCYMFVVALDFNNEYEREIDKLTTVEITGDIEETETIED